MVFSFFLLSSFWRLISEVTERISTKLGHTFTYDFYLKNFVRTPPRHVPSQARTDLCKGTWYQQSKTNLSIIRDSPTCPPSLVNFGPQMAENGWRVPPPKKKKFASIDTASLTAWTLYNRQQANFGTCYIVVRASRSEQQNARRAHAGLCHASSYNC